MATQAAFREEMGKRAVRVANCSGAHGDPGFQMRRQLELGPVDFVTGDYLAEMNLAENATAYREGQHPGYELTALDGLVESIDLIHQTGAKVVINGGSLNPAGLAEKCRELACSREYNLKLAYVSGDDLLDQVLNKVKSGDHIPDHLDATNAQVKLDHLTKSFVTDVEYRQLVSANAYLGARAIVKALESGADIVICGRVADASPVIGAAWYWHSWSDTDYDRLAGALVAGHLIECSAYVTGANYTGFDELDMDALIDVGFPIAEIAHDGTCVISKHENTKGLVSKDTVECQFLYELQGTAYLNSDVTALLDDVSIEECSHNRYFFTCGNPFPHETPANKSTVPTRVRVSGIRGQPPPSTTKLAIFYQGGFRSEFLLNATGYATDEKWDLYEAQIRYGVEQRGLQNQLDVLEFQRVGRPESNALTQLRSTTYLRVFGQAAARETLINLHKVIREYGMQHFSGAHRSLDLRTALPRPYVAYYPAVVPQDQLKESAIILHADGTIEKQIDAGHPPSHQDVPARKSYGPVNQIEMDSFGPTTTICLGDVALGRSGDKGANINIGLFVRDESTWRWFASFMTISRMTQLIGDDWSDDFFIERVEFPNIYAVHFVIYGILGRGVTSTARLDCLGKGFADFIRGRHVEVPLSILGHAKRFRFAQKKNVR